MNAHQRPTVETPVGSKMLVMGSCRVTSPLGALPNVILYPGGSVHTSAEFVQAVRIMQGEISPPEELVPYLFRGDGLRDEKTQDLAEIDTVVVELCSLKYYPYRGWLLHMLYEDRIRSGELQRLEGADLKLESRDDVLSNLDTLAGMLTGKKLVVFLQHNIPQLHQRYLLASAAADWCARNGAQLVDATSIIAEHGVHACLPLVGGERDYLHYTEYMRARVADVFRDPEASDSSPPVSTPAPLDADTNDSPQKAKWSVLERLKRPR